MLKLTDKNWKAFALKDIFYEIKRGKRLIKANHVAGAMPYVSSTALNNGVDQFIGNKNKVRKFRDCITIANSGSVGSSFYHSYEFIASDHVTQLNRSGCNKYSYLFVVTMLKGLSCKYSFNREISDKRIGREVILLPVMSDGKPDWAFMEAYMRHVEQEILKPAIQKLKARITDAPKPIGGGNWKAFALKDIFTINPGIRLTKAKMTSGNRPFIGATDSNNGITEWVDNINPSIDNNVLGINYNGSVCETFYHPYECIFSDDVKRLHLQHRNNTELIMLFMKTTILKQKEKYSYGYKFNEKRMEAQKILLPVTTNGTPDWQYMEAYMKYAEQVTLKQTIQALSTRIAPIPCA